MNISPSTYSSYQFTPAINPSQDASQGQKKTRPLDDQEFNFDRTTTSEVQANAPADTAQTPYQSDAAATAENKSEPESNTAESPNEQAAKEVVNGRELDQNELRLLAVLKKADTEVRQHEMAHIAAGGRYITSGASFNYQKGPDGKNYAVSGEVGIDTAPIPGDPQATIQKMRQIKSSALAPASPSSQDLKVAAKATSAGAKASSELMLLQAKERAGASEEKAFGYLKKAADTYEKVNDLPEDNTSSFEIAV